MNINNIKLALGLMFAATVGFTSCADQPDKYESTGGKPTISYFRLADAASKDSIISGAYMQTPICIVGSNLKSIKEMYFNDQKAVLNTSYITDNTLLVSVPKNMPEKVTDKLYVVTADNDSLSYDFKVLVNAPSVSSMDNEWAKAGDKAVIYGDYFYDYADNPIKITFPSGKVITSGTSAVTSVTPNAITFTVPEDPGKGYITVESVYGKGRSKFYFRDDRFILFDWDAAHGKAMACGHGWRDAGSKVGQSVVPPLDGNYATFSGHLAGDNSTWGEDDFSFNYWPEPGAGYPELSAMYDFSDPANTVLKFEVYVSKPWAACSMQLIFTGNDEVTMASPTNSYIADDNFPRALWTPWVSGPYTTSGWRTVTIPLSNFKYTKTGTVLSANTSKFTGFTLFVYNGPYTGADCDPEISIDNIRIAPAN